MEGPNGSGRAGIEFVVDVTVGDSAMGVELVWFGLGANGSSYVL